VRAWTGRTEGEEIPAPLRLGDREVAALIGWGGLEVRDPGVDLLELCAVYARAVSDLSCGQCIPCREGARVLAGLVEAFRGGARDGAILDQIRLLAETMKETSRCDIGKTSPGAILSALERLREPCRAGNGAPEQEAMPGRFVYRSILTAPCMQACPLHVDIPRYVEHTRNGRFQEALETIQERLPFAGVVGRVCVKPCESNCRRGLLDDPIQIRHLKRFVADRARKLAGAGGSSAPAPEPGGAQPPGGEGRRAAASAARVAVVGAGPAGFTCAKVLAGQGHQVTVFERQPGPGGMLGVAIPSYRLPVGILEEEVKAIEEMGVSIAYGKALGRDCTLADLRGQGFQAVFIAVGAHRATVLGLEGDCRAQGVWDCLEFLHRAKLGEKIAVGDKVVVLGGGNVAIDVARTARRLGAADVRIVYRRTRRQMRAHRWEIEEALEEGISVEECWAPKGIVSQEGRVRGIEVTRSVLDESRRGDPRCDESERTTFDADTVVFAIGMAVDAGFREGIEELELLPDGRIKADPLTLQTSVAGVFAGGDCVTGPNIVVQACAHGLLAGLQIARYLAGDPVGPREESLEEKLVDQLRVFDAGEKVALPPGDGRLGVAQEPAAERTRDFREVEAGFTPDEAMAEASRCLRCYRVVTCAYRA
jgi:formate dehydrogenase beta subunit